MRASRSKLFKTSLIYENYYRNSRRLCLISLRSGNTLVVDTQSSQLITETLPATTPENGIVLSKEVTIPAFKHGAYYRPFSGGVARGNRVEAVAFKSIAELSKYRFSKTRAKHTSVSQGQFILLELTEGGYLALLPMTSPEVYGQFFIEQGKLLLKTGNYGTDTVEGEIPLLCWASGDSPYSATREVWKQVFASGYVDGKPRANKSFPEEPYGYLGWCSWEHYKRDISAEVITKAAETLEASPAPFRWLMVDDGYFTEKGRKLTNLEPLPKKFPNGWRTRLHLG